MKRVRSGEAPGGSRMSQEGFTQVPRPTSNLREGSDSSHPSWLEPVKDGAEGCGTPMPASLA